ncbi:hypothetical protein BbiDN127_I0020 (plasmid) [Borreliella bissettiae DN127]|uniref:Uncharacterized protein n=1 Tax=Borrelia bissettiae (strain DSM 17990 / CIP 109136 / DN127) TaxID=521010 RepID=G0AP77_BORBD|nr:hypothetical protein BbiDN127_I0020 [Borreliella bissettiae DN127]
MIHYKACFSRNNTRIPKPKRILIAILIQIDKIFFHKILNIPLLNC